MDIILKKIYWERANLHIEITGKYKSIYLFYADKKYPLKCFNNEIIIPFYNIPPRKTLASGQWKIIIDEHALEIEPSMLKELANYTRLFRYKTNYAYAVDLTTDEDYSLIIRTEFYRTNKEPMKDHLSLKKYIEYGISNILYKLIHLFSGKKNILLFSENDDKLSVNLEPLKEHLQELPNYKVRSLTKNCFKNKTSISYRLKEICVLASASYIFIDNYTPILTYLKLSSDVKLIQIWHAGVGFKSVGYARFGLSGSPHPYISGHRQNTHVIVDNEKLINIYEEVFGIDSANIYPYGLPRLDKFLNQEVITLKKEALKELFPEIKDKKVILFAPTYRGNGQKDAYYDMEYINQDKLSKFCQDNKAIILFKFHPFTNNKLIIEQKNQKYLIDVNHYTSINDLLYITDILVTDYSSCTYEASLLDIPIIFYRYDKEQYEYERGIHTADVFESKTYEALNSQEMLKYLKELLKYKKKNIKNIERDSCKKIIKEIFGE